MGWYDQYILPRAIDFSCSRKGNMEQRKLVVPQLQGDVLEVGVGTGLNIPLYQADKIKHLFALDPSPEMISLARKKSDVVNFALDYLLDSAESIPLRSGSIDSVLITYSLCTIADAEAALAEIRRVLKPGGKLYFCEHGKAPDTTVQFWQNSLNRPWGYVSGGCNLNRDIPGLLTKAGFTIQEMNKHYIPGWKPLSYTYRGCAI